MGKFENKTVFITGASSGIGRELALKFASEGANVSIVARRLDRLKELAGQIQALGKRALTYSCDVTREGDIETALVTTATLMGGVDVVVANAGFGVMGKMEQLSIEDYRNQFETNVFGLLRTVASGVRELKKTKGTLVLIGSVASHVSIAGMSAYSMSKFAVRALADAIRYELAPYGVSVVLISPGIIETEFQQVDNKGVYHSNMKRSAPHWLSMSSQVAATQMINAIARKKKEAIITGHGKVTVFIKRHMPWLIDGVLKVAKIKPRADM